MAKVLSKYAQAKDLTRVQYTSQREYMEAIAAQQQEKIPEDLRTPFSFRQWLDRNTGIIPGEEYNQYNQYLKNWYTSRYTTTNASLNIKDDYISLLKELTLTLGANNEIFDWAKDIDFSNNLELEDAIPYFVKKLKEIAIYLVNKREAVRRAKLKYNMSGAKNALEKLFYEYLLKAFTKRNYVLNVPEQSALNTFPDLSAINKGFSISVQELYDDTQYMDKDSMVSAADYFDLANSNLVSFFDADTGTFAFDGNLNELFSTGFSLLCAENPLLCILDNMITQSVSAYSDESKTTLNDYLRISLTNKYMGETKYILSGGYWLLDAKDFNYTLQQGNNWFYWPSGEHTTEIDSINYDPIELSATSLIENGAAGSEIYQNADKIFLIYDNAISGAWLKTTIQDTVANTMSAVIPKNGIIFMFPYPGYGVSGEGLDWTGKQLDNIDSSYNYLDNDIKEAIQKLYWTTIYENSAVKPIAINNTTLIESEGIVANQEYQNADKITLRLTTNKDNIHDNNPDYIYKDNFDRAWLYKPLKTDLPIKVGYNYLYWPLVKYDQNNINIPINILSSQCVNIPLSTIDVENTMIGARAGHNVFDSDLIYKLDSANGFSIECAYLSGEDLATLVPGATGKIQPSLTLRCKPGNYETFIWQDNNININNTTICHKEHQKDCLYINSDHESIYNAKMETLAELNRTETGISNWKNCTCKAILYSPIGHPGNKYDDYDRMTDIIFADTSWPEPFDITTWQGRDGKSYIDSTDFAWFRLTGSNIEPDVGWGRGSWQTNTGAAFTLGKGIQYKILRANLRRNPEDLFINAVPDLYIKHSYTNTPKTKWVKALLNQDGTWTGSSSASDMILKPGDFIMYDHVDSNWYCLTSAGTYGPSYSWESSSLNVIGDLISGTDASNWTNITYVTTGNDIKISITWPDFVYITGPSQLPQQLSSIDWDIIYPNNTHHFLQDADPDESIDFIVDNLVGIYYISAVGYGRYGLESITHIPNTYGTFIPPVTAVSKELTTSVSGEKEIYTIYSDRINFTINIPLTGWNYTTASYDGSSVGGRPFWAASDENSSNITKYKGTPYWGGNIITNEATMDSYTFLTQPDVATFELSADKEITYEHKGSGLTWVQPIEIEANIVNNKWNKILVEQSVVSPLSDYLFNVKNEMIASGLEIESDIIIKKPIDGNVLINYWANEAFTWTQELTNSTEGLPPTGGIWAPTVTGLLIDPDAPYANLTNRHYPTIVMVPNIGNLYSQEDVGGYFVPKMLGASTYIGKDYTNIIDTTNLPNSNNRGLSAVFSDPAIYTSDYGLTNTLQVTPISTKYIDAGWTKASITQSAKSGQLVDAKAYQEFIPYQTKYESTGKNSFGIKTQSDSYDPWNGIHDNTWADTELYPPNFRNEYDIEGWYEDKVLDQDKIVYQWKTDIFGNQYFLLKNRNIATIYDRNNAPGELWVRDQNGLTTEGTKALSGIYDNLTVISESVSADIVTGNIKNIDLWFDTLMIRTSGYVIFEKIDFDYDYNIISSVADNLHNINLSADQGGKFAGTWLFDESKKITVCVVNSAEYSQGIIYPTIYNLDLNTNEMNMQYNGYNNVYINQLSALCLTSIEDPVFTYNETTKEYNITFLGYGQLYDNMILNVIGIKNYGSNTDPIKITSMIPLV